MAALGQGISGLAHSHEDFMAVVAAQIGQLTEWMERFFSRPDKTDTVSAAPEPPPVPTTAYAGAGARLAPPERFSGDLGQCK